MAEGAPWSWEKVSAALDAAGAVLSDGVILVDEAGVAIYTNPAAARTLELLGPGAIDKVRGVVDGGRRPEFTAGGRIYAVETTSRAGLRAYLLRDVTKSRELDRLKAEFFANTSHELRTPLNAVIGFTELSLEEEDGPLSEGHRHNLERVLENARGLLGMINNILDLTKLESYKMDVRIDPVDIHRLVGESLEAVRPLLRDKAIVLSRDIVGPIGDLRTDTEKLRRVLVNLLGNAIKYTDRGEVRLVVRVADADGEKVVFSIEDTGIGIAPADQAHLFERFRQVDGSSTRRVGGAGLGLAIVKELVTLLGGEVALVSVPGQGSIFTVSLPRQIPHAMRRREDQETRRLPEGV